MKYSIYTISDTSVTVSEAEAPERDGFLVDITEQSRRSASYRRDIRGIVRKLWSGAIDIDQAFSLFSDTVRLGLTRAWHEGAAECGIQPSELSPQETTELRRVIASESSRIFSFLLNVEANSKANGGNAAPLLNSAGMWALRYDDVVTRAKLQACSDQKLRWTINYTRVVKDNCSSCLKLDGKIKRASYWRQAGIQPQNPPNPNLVCGGWLCGCGVPVTDEPLSRGPLPRLP